MQLYHHPYSIDSQRVRLALEEKNIDYTSFHLNPITGKNMNVSFFRMNPNATLPVFQNGDHKIFKMIEIIQYVERIASVSSGSENMNFSDREVTEWMQRIQGWNPKYFTLAHIPEKYFRSVSKFLRRVVMARMEESPDLAGAYHRKLQQIYDTEDKLKNSSIVVQDKEHLIRLLDGVEKQLNETEYLVGEGFTMADLMLIPVLARLVLLNLEDEYIGTRPNLVKYWIMVQQRPSYKKVIANHFCGWRKYRTLTKTWCSIQLRSITKRF